jgi:DNA modification methylase
VTPDPTYRAFLEAKVKLAGSSGFDVAETHPWLKPHAGAAVRWMLRGGRRAVFANFGLAKTSMQLEAGRQVVDRLAAQGRHARGLIVAPLGVRQEFARDAGMLGIEIPFVQSHVECFGAGLYLTNYDSVVDGRIDPSGFDFLSLDEAACLRGMGGTKTFREMMRIGEDVPFRFVATATPSPNDFIELLAYAAFLGVMDVGEAKTRFFQRNSEQADKLTLHPHKEREFWLWVASWALFITRPSDLGFSDEGYELPAMTVRWHEVKVDHREAAPEKGGQGVLFRDAALGVAESAREKRATLAARVQRLAAIVAAEPDEHRILWHDLEAERELIEQAVPGSFSVYGSQDGQVNTDRIIAFSDGLFPFLAAKPVMAGAGCNFQRHCSKAVFVGVGFKFHDFIQAIHRVQRFGQVQPVEIDVIYAESERGVRQQLERKWRQHDLMVRKMTGIIREFGLSNIDMAKSLQRSMGVERVEVMGEGYSIVNNDTVDECARMAENSVDLIVTSIPFSTQYEYSPRYEDFGHTDDNGHFFRQMGFLIPNLLRVLKPGRDACIHVKDRIVPGGLTGLGFQTVYPFADDTRRAFMEAGFAYLGEITNLTDVVRENAQTYRLGWSEQLRDGSRMGAGIPEKILLFRKPPSDLSNGYADTPVEKARPDYVDAAGHPVSYGTAGAIPEPGTGYSRGRWQMDAHHLRRASGDRLLAVEEWASWDKLDQVYRLWREFNLGEVYDFEQHVRIGEKLDVMGKLPPTFMLLPPHSWHPDVWTDVAQMLSMNTLQSQAGAEKHLCPMPFDIADRLIVQRSMPGELVFDPFGGLGTVPFRALKHGRRGACVELNADYFLAACKYVEAAAREKAMPTLFDVLEAVEGERAA